MRVRILMAVLLGILSLALVACSTPAVEPEPGTDTPAVGEGEQPPGDAAGLRLAPGLYDLDGGKVQALGVLERRDIEGGFWVVVDTTGQQPGDGETVAVIANSDEFARQLTPLTGQSVVAVGTRSEGASIRMAGPEIVLESIEAVTDTPGIAE